MTTRVYIPVTVPILRTWVAAGAAPAPLAAHAVTREFARDYELPDAPDDDEMLRFEALTDAGLASRALPRDDSTNPAAVVVEADVAEDSVRSTPGDGSGISVLIDVPIARWVAVYLQPPDAAGLPDDGGDVASFGDLDLTWFAVQELAEVLQAF